MRKSLALGPGALHPDQARLVERVPIGITTSTGPSGDKEAVSARDRVLATCDPKDVAPFYIHLAEFVAARKPHVPGLELEGKKERYLLEQLAKVFETEEHTIVAALPPTEEVHSSSVGAARGARCRRRA